ncbi:MAG: hypothetical protein CSB24_04875 [Deltaproteobacteria bacterium]|nr:MAG: hypothetical protein CSB24_04875 [Deltaproteobacteria bacterium]
MARLQLRKTHVFIWVLFILTLIVPLLAAGWLTLRLGSADFAASLVSAVSRGGDAAASSLLLGMRASILICLALILAGGVAALIMLYRFILRPAGEMSKFACRIADGDLELSVPEYACPEMDGIGKSLNDLSTNFQEVVLLVWKTIQRAGPVLEQLTDGRETKQGEEDSAPQEEDIMAVREELETIEYFMTNFKLYDILIVDNKAMAGDKTWPGDLQD